MKNMGYTGMVKANLKRYTRSVLATLLTGPLPLEVEVGRFTRVESEDRTCKLCNIKATEDNYHFLFSCVPLQGTSSMFYVQVLENLESLALLPDGDKVRFLKLEIGMKQLG